MVAPCYAQADAEPMDDLESEGSALSLLGRLRVTRFAEMLQGSSEERLRAVERLSSMATPHALGRLSDWLTSSPVLSAEERYRVVWSVAPHAATSAVQLWLFRTLTGPQVSTDPQRDATPPNDYQEMAERSAALALAASGDYQALRLLDQVLRRDTRASEFASEALKSHPPQKLQALLENDRNRSLTWVRTLDALGDQRAFDVLRESVRRGSPPIQAAAALALLHLGDLETVELAHYWHARGVTHPDLQVASTEILLEGDPDRAGASFQRLLLQKPEAALRLALRLPAQVLEATLMESFSELDASLQALCLEVLGAIGTPAALGFVSEQLTSRENGLHAALALARSPSERASDVLIRQATRADRSALAIKALVVRGYLQGTPSSALRKTLERWSSSNHPLERKLGRWGRAIFDPEFAKLEVGRAEGDDLLAVAQAAFVQPGDFFAAAASRIDRDRSSETLRAALSFSLVHEQGADRITTGQLLRWAHASPPLAIAAVSRLAARPGVDPSLLQEFQSSPDVAVRAALYLGLGRNPDRAHYGTLERAYLKEVDPAARLAIVSALSQRDPSSYALEVVRLAARLDPDPRVLQAARLALGGQAITTSPLGHDVLWLALAPESRCRRAVLVQNAVQAIPLGLENVSDVPLLGLNAVPFTVRLALDRQLMNSAACRPPKP
jgi:HEAT repeats